MNIKKIGLAIALVSFCIFCLFYIWSNKPELVNQLGDSSFSNQVDTTSPTPKPTLTEQQQADKLHTGAIGYFLDDLLPGAPHEQQIKNNKIVSVFTIYTDPDGKRFDLVDTISDIKSDQHEWFLVKGKDSYQLEKSESQKTIADFHTFTKEVKYQRKSDSELLTYEKFGITYEPTHVVVMTNFDNSFLNDATVYDLKSFKKVKMQGPSYKNNYDLLSTVDPAAETSWPTTQNGDLYHFTNISFHDNKYILATYNIPGHPEAGGNMVVPNIYLVFSVQTGQVVDKLEFN